MKINYTLFFTLLLVSSAPAENRFKAVRINQEVWEIVFPDKVLPHGGRYIVEIDDTKRGISGFGQLLILKSTEVLHLTEKHLGMDIRPAERNGKKGIEITSHWIDRRTGKMTDAISFEEQHEENPKEIPQVDPVAARAWDHAKSYIENGEKDKALETLAFLKKYLSPILTKTEADSDQPATKPADKSSSKDQPSTPTLKDAP